MCRTYLILHVKLVDYDFIDTIKLLDLLLTVPFKFLACMKTFGSYLLFNSCLVGLRIVTAVGSSMRLDKFEILEVLVPGGYRGRATSMPNHPSCKSKGYIFNVHPSTGIVMRRVMVKQIYLKSSMRKDEG